MDKAIFAFEHIEWGIGYIITILIFIIFAILSNIYKTNKFIYAFLIYLIIFSSTRDIVNFDMENYKEMYENYKTLAVLQIEPGFIFLSWLLNHFTSNAYSLFFVYSFLNILFVYLGIKNLTPYIKTSFFLFLTIPMLYLMTLIGIRQSLAEAIMFFAVSFLLKGKKVLFLLFALLAIIFHYSAFITLIIVYLTYLIFKYKLRIKFLFSFLIISLMVYLLNMNSFLLKTLLEIIFPLLPEKYTLYAQFLLAEGKVEIPGFSIYTTLLFNMLTLLTSYYSNILIKTARLHKNYSLIINLLVIGTIYMNLFGEFADVTARIFYYFVFYYIILIPFIIYKMLKQTDKILIVYALSIFLLIWLFSGVYKQIIPNEHPPMIYKNILMKDIF
jgi:hypothetical protein